LIFIAVDFSVTQILKRNIDSLIKMKNFYQPTDYHHDLIPGEDSRRVWANVGYRHITDGNGLRVGPCPGDVSGSKPPKKTSTVYIVGDSFAEGVGIAYEKTFAGLIACKYRTGGANILNLGASSLSPIIYHRKIRKIVEKTGTPPDHIIVFLDISDIHDEAVKYMEQDGKVIYAPSESGPPSMFERFSEKADKFMLRNFTSYLVYYYIRKKISALFGTTEDLSDYVVKKYITNIDARRLSVGNTFSRWTMDADLFEKYGRRGLEIASKNLKKITDICREIGCGVTLAVYPWPDQIYEKDEQSLQVTYWRKWADRENVQFINLFPPFFGNDPVETIRNNFIPGDYHWNENGHRLIFDELDKHIRGAPYLTAK
ncbi:MAG: SGNH/GDSL hydrolase family protein, partial [Rhodospirillales bacterium]|nr:SGNH/GDSL hydrolase family protein [Rhodospirillales bacterium]